MFRPLISASLLFAASAGIQNAASTTAESEIRDFIARWNAAYTGLDAAGLAALESPDYEMVDRFGHWIKSEGPAFNRRLWAITFSDIYHGKPGPARQIESIRFLTPTVALVEARANHEHGVTLDDGTRIPPFWRLTRTRWSEPARAGESPCSTFTTKSIPLLRVLGSTCLRRRNILINRTSKTDQ